MHVEIFNDKITEEPRARHDDKELFGYHMITEIFPPGSNYPFVSVEALLLQIGPYSKLLYEYFEKNPEVEGVKILKKYLEQHPEEAKKYTLPDYLKR